MTSEPTPGAYAPLVAARYPGEGTARSNQRLPAPLWRVLVHRKQVDDWGRLGEVCGQSNAEELWLHLTQQPDQKPRLGTVTPMRGKLGKATADGWSRVYHYEVTGAARVDYRFHAAYRTSRSGDAHRVVSIVLVSLGSH